MPHENPKLAWGQIVIAALITALFSLAGGIILYHYKSKKADLVYEVFPAAHFDKQGTRVSIYNARVENMGHKEAEDVKVYFQLPSTCHIQGIKVETNFKSIKHTVAKPKTHARTVIFPLFNPGDKSRFSVLVDEGKMDPMTVEVRAKGLTGHPKPSEDSPAVLTNLSIATAFLSLLGVLIALFYTIVTKVRSEKKFSDIVDTEKNKLDKEIQFLRTQGSPPDKNIRTVLLNSKYRLFYNPKIPGLSKTKIIRFGEDGRILEGQNNNESAWRIQNDFLEILNAHGNVHSRFYYSPSDGRFYQTNDSDNTSITKHGIKDQYMIPEE